jgi:hypothetical protein
MSEAAPTGLRGPLAHVLQTRGGRDAAGGLAIEHREALVYTLGKAAEIEHLIMLTYLYAAFSLKTADTDGLTPDQLAATKRWRRTLYELAAQEMLHLALCQNLLTAVGAGPRFARPNFPVPSHVFPAGVQIRLMAFDETAVRHFAHLERPAGMAFDDAEGFEALKEAVPAPFDADDEIAPHLQDFDTIGGLYRTVEDAIERLAAKLGPERLFIGPARSQATEAHFRWPELVAVTDVASARQAIDTIVEQGEGARGEWRDAHFGRLVSMLEELRALQAADPGFVPARPVVAAQVRPSKRSDPAALIEDPGTARAADLLNVVNEVLLQLLSRYFANTEETDEQLAVLADTAVGLMYGAIVPLGMAISKQPIALDRPGVTAGATFELFYDVDYLLPHKRAAWVLMEERLRDAAAFATRCRGACTLELMTPLAKVAAALEKAADALAGAMDPA